MNIIKYDPLDSLDDTKYEWKIKFRVIRSWDSYSTRSEKEIKDRNIFLLDDKICRLIFFA